MIVSSPFLNKLKDLGLNSYETKLWVALLSRGLSTAGELSDLANVPRSRSYDVLESLEKKGFIIIKSGKPIKYLAVPPAEVIDRVKKRIKEETHQKHALLDQLKESKILAELNALYTQGVKLIDPLDKTGVFRGRNKIYEHLALMIKKAQKKILLMTTPSGLERKKEIFFSQFKKAAQKGVRIKIVVPRSLNKQSLNSFSKIAEVKQTSRNTSRFCLVDDQELLLMLTDDQVHPESDCAVWISSPYFVNYFNTLVEGNS